MKNMIQVQVDASVFEDSYMDGEGKYVNAWTEVQEFHDMYPKDAVETLFRDTIGYEFNWKHITIDEEDSNRFFYSVMVDKDNMEACQGQIDSWKEGTTQLYVSNLDVTVTYYVSQPANVNISSIKRDVITDGLTSKMISDEAQKVFDTMYSLEDIMKGNTVEMMKEARFIAIQRLKEG